MAFATGHALLIGVGTYANKPGWQVPITVEDARGVAAVLKDTSYCGYPAEQVTLLHDAGATRRAALEALDALAQTTTPESTVMVFYSGHGEYDAQGVFYLTTHDAQTDANRKIVPGTSLSQAELLQKLRAIKARRMLLVFNACHAGDVVVLGDEAEPTPQANLPADTAAAVLASGEGRIILTACRAEQFSFVGKGSSMTIFAEALVRGLKGEGTLSNSGYISIFDLYNYLFDAVGDAVQDDTRVPAETRRRYGGKQEPELTILKQVGPFAVALYKGAAALGEFDPAADAVEGKALRQITRSEAREKLSQQIAVAGSVVGGDQHNVGGSQFNAGGDMTNVGNTTSIGGDWVGGDKVAGDKVGGNKIDARGSQGFLNQPGGAVNQSFGPLTTISGNLTGTNLNIGSTLTNVSQTIGSAPGLDQSQKEELTRLMAQLAEALQQAPQSPDAARVATRAAAAAAEVAKDTPDTEAVEFNLSSLEKTAKSIEAVAPGVLRAATLVAKSIRTIVGL